MMFKKMCYMLSLSFVLVVAPSAMASGIITDGDAVFEVLDGSLGQYNLMPDGVAGADYLCESSWFYYFGGMHAIDTPTSETYDANIATFTGSGSGFGWTLTVQLTDGEAAGCAVLDETLVMQYMAPQPAMGSFYAYTDLDAGGTALNDEATLDGDIIRATDALNGQYAELQSSLSGASIQNACYQAGDPATIRGLFDTSSVVTLDDTGLPFASGDFAVAQQWQCPIPPFRTITMTKTTTLAVPEPATAMLLAIGALAALRRRR